MYFIEFDTEENNARNKAVAHAISIFGYVLAPIRHRLYYRITRILGRLVGKHITCILHLRMDALFRFCLYDPYWNRLLCEKYKYEGEIEHVLKAFRGINYSFIDCGANYGYWSILVSSEDFGSKPAFAIEAVKSTYLFLEINQKLNNNRFRTLHRAIGLDSGKQVTIGYPASGLHSHAGATTVFSERTGGGMSYETVETISINDMIAKFEIGNNSLIIKLDVEGVEVDALKGAPDLFDRDLICIYEDHGNDSECTVSQYLMNRGLAIFYVDDSKIVRQIFDWWEIRGLKTQRSRGYNFFATSYNSQFFGHLNELTK